MGVRANWGRGLGAGLSALGEYLINKDMREQERKQRLADVEAQQQWQMDLADYRHGQSMELQDARNRDAVNQLLLGQAFGRDGPASPETFDFTFPAGIPGVGGQTEQFPMSQKGPMYREYYGAPGAADVAAGPRPYTDPQGVVVDPGEDEYAKSVRATALATGMEPWAQAGGPMEWVDPMLAVTMKNELERATKGLSYDAKKGGYLVSGGGNIFKKDVRATHADFVRDIIAPRLNDGTNRSEWATVRKWAQENGVSERDVLGGMNELDPLIRMAIVETEKMADDMGRPDEIFIQTGPDGVRRPYARYGKDVYEVEESQ